MGRRVRGATPTDPPAGDYLWCGELDFPVMSPSGTHLGQVELTVRRDDLEVRFADRHLAVVDRKALRRWLNRPTGPYLTDAVTWVARGRARLIALDQAPPTPLPPRIIGQLTAVL